MINLTLEYNMSIKLKNYTILKSMITSYAVKQSARTLYDYACIKICVIGGQEHMAEIYYNFKPEPPSNEQSTEEWARFYHSVMTEAEVNKIIKQLNNLK